MLSVLPSLEVLLRSSLGSWMCFEGGGLVFPRACSLGRQLLFESPGEVPRQLGLLGSARASLAQWVCCDTRGSRPWWRTARGHRASCTICQVSRHPFLPEALSAGPFLLSGGVKQPGYLPRDESLSLWRSQLLLRDQSHIQQGKHLPGPEYLSLPFSPASSELPVLRPVCLIDT